MPSEMTTTQKIVFTPKFQPMMNPATSSSTAFRKKTIVPIWMSMPTCERAWHSTSERPAAPPPVPLTGMMQPIQPNE